MCDANNNGCCKTSRPQFDELICMQKLELPVAADRIGFVLKSAISIRAVWKIVLNNLGYNTAYKSKPRILNDMIHEESACN